MKISSISEIEYKYIFSLDNIKLAKQLNQDRCETIKNISFISTEIKNKVSEFSKDFDMLAEKIINRDNIEDTDTYDFTHQAITICNARIADLLNSEELNNEAYQKHIKKNKDIAKKINCFEMINSKLGNSNYFEIKLNNWFTIFLLGFLIIFFSVLFIIAYINQNAQDIVLLSIICAILVLVIFFKIKKIDKMIKHDYIQRIISRKEYSASKTQEKYDHYFFDMIKNIAENKL